MDYRAYIEGTEVEIEKVSQPIDLSCYKDFTTKANKSKVIKAPATPGNKVIFDFLDEAAADSTISGLTGKLTNGMFTLNGMVKIYDTTTIKGKTYYQFQIISGNGDWVKQIEGKDLSDCSLDLSHAYTKAIINASEAGTLDYLYPLTNYGVFGGTDEVYIEDRLPAVKIYSLITQIFKDIGYSITSAFLSAASFSKWFMTFGKNPDIYTESFREESMFQASLSADDEPSQTISDGATGVNIVLFNSNTENFQTVKFADDSTGDNFDNGTNFDTGTYKYTCPADGSYKFEANVLVELTWHIPIEDVDPTFKIEIIKNGSTVVATDTDSSYTYASGNVTTGKILLECDTGFQHFEEDDYFTVKITVTGTVGNAGGKDEDIDFHIYKRDNVYFKNDLLLRPAENYTWLDILPNMSQKEFLKAVFTVFGLTLCTNTDERMVYIEPEDDFYSGAWDWTDKLDTSKKVIVLQRDIDKWIDFQFKVDGNDSQIVNYKCRAELDNGDGESEVDVLFADTLMDYCREIGLTSVKIPKLWNKKESYPDIPEQYMSFLSRLLYYDGQTALPSGETWTFDGDTMSTYPKFTRWSMKDFVEEYHQNRLYILNNNKRIKAYFNLTGTDISNINNCAGNDFRKKVYLFNNLWRIDNISYREDQTTLVGLTLSRLDKTGVTLSEIELLETGTSGGGGGGTTGTSTSTSYLITDTAVISEITDESNWTNGNYTGSTSGMSEGEYYIDYTNKIEYKFNGTNLVRYWVNMVV